MTEISGTGTKKTSTNPAAGTKSNESSSSSSAPPEDKPLVVQQPKRRLIKADLDALYSLEPHVSSKTVISIVVLS